MTKTLKGKLYILLLGILLSISSESYGQCGDRDKVFKCAQFFGDSIIFLNDFEVVKAKRKVEEDPNGEVLEVFLMEGTEYRFAMCGCSSLKDIVMTLYSNSVPESEAYGSTYINGKNQRYYDFICKDSGVYKVSIRFKKENVIGKELSALGILGFIRKVKNY